MKNIFLILITLVPFVTKAQVTLIPDGTVERNLIYWGIDSDGIVNGQILTSDALNATSLDFINGFYTGIMDLDGIEDFINIELLTVQFMDNYKGSANFSTLTKLKKIHYFSNNLTIFDLSTNTNLEELVIKNGTLDTQGYNTVKELNLSNNNKLKYIELHELYGLELINMQNNTVDSVSIVLGVQINYPYGVCIQVDDPIAATNGIAPYDNWSVVVGANTTYYFSDKCTLNNETFIQNSFKIYPNPAAEYVSVEYDENAGVQLRGVQILDSSGKWIHSVNENFHQIMISDLSSGVYLFVIQTDKGNKTEKVVVK